MAKSGANWRTIVLVVVLLVSFILLGIGIAFYGNTLTKWWVPVMPAAVVAAVTVPVLAPRWRSLTESGSMIYNGACHLFAMFSLVYFLFLGSNYFMVDDSTLVVEKTEVISKYSKEHTRYRRVSRNRRVPDGHYYTYHILLRFPDGREKEQEVQLKSYNRIRTGSTRDIKVEKGLWGLSVIKR
ncbi:MAG: hypothetical protein K2J42_07615 [Muribaculaceae bacterium]|nr:hypothetical protein [Muribaculaceae bacterium]